MHDEKTDDFVKWASGLDLARRETARFIAGSLRDLSDDDLARTRQAAEVCGPAELVAIAQRETERRIR